MNEESVFVAALARSTASERQAFLERARTGDVALRQRVERMLAARLYEAWGQAEKAAEWRTKLLNPGEAKPKP